MIHLRQLDTAVTDTVQAHIPLMNAKLFHAVSHECHHLWRNETLAGIKIQAISLVNIT